MIVQTQKVSSSDAEKPHEYWLAATQRLALKSVPTSKLCPFQAQSGLMAVMLRAGPERSNSVPRMEIVLVTLARPACFCNEVHEHRGLPLSLSSGPGHVYVPGSETQLTEIV